MVAQKNHLNEMVILSTHKHMLPLMGKKIFTNLWSKYLLNLSLFDLILYVQVNNFQLCWDRSSWVEPVTKQGLMCLAQGHNSVTSVRLEPATPWSQVKHSTTEPLHSLKYLLIISSLLILPYKQGLVVSS